jgi:hypothetical protein
MGYGQHPPRPLFIFLVLHARAQRSHSQPSSSLGNKTHDTQNYDTKDDDGVHPHTRLNGIDYRRQEVQEKQINVLTRQDSNPSLLLPQSLKALK